MSEQLSAGEEAWCSFMDKWAAKGLTGEPQPSHAFDQGFLTGEKVERARSRREFAAWFWSKATQDERVEDFMSALDRICPAGPEEG